MRFEERRNRTDREIEEDNLRFDRENAEVEARIKALVARINKFDIGSPEYLAIERELEEISASGEDADTLVHHYYWNAGG